MLVAIRHRFSDRKKMIVWIVLERKDQHGPMIHRRVGDAGLDATALDKAETCWRDNMAAEAAGAGAALPMVGFEKKQKDSAEVHLMTESAADGMHEDDDVLKGCKGGGWDWKSAPWQIDR